MKFNKHITLLFVLGLSVLVLSYGSSKATNRFKCSNGKNSCFTWLLNNEQDTIEKYLIGEWLDTINRHSQKLTFRENGKYIHENLVNGLIENGTYSIKDNIITLTNDKETEFVPIKFKFVNSLKKGIYLTGKNIDKKRKFRKIK